MSIWICGEILVDLLPHGAFIGGGPANTARALGRLEQEVEFIDGISSDEYGQRARRSLLRDGVGLRHIHMSEKPTATATVVLNRDGVATYRFLTYETATFDFQLSWLPDPSRFKPSLLYVGTLATLIEPGATELLSWARVVSEFAPVIYDPNIRSAVLGDREKYLHNVDKWIEISSVVKVSKDDLAWLYPNEPYEAVARKWIDRGVVLVIVTLGDKGVSGFTIDESIEVPGANIDVVDTVGAGDTVGAILVNAIQEFGPLNLRGEVLKQVLNCAVIAAGITCSRAGAEPPTRSELMVELERSGRDAIY